MTKEAKLKERLERILRAVALEPVDRPPVVLEYAGFAAQVTKAPLPRFFTEPEYSLQKMIEAWGIVCRDFEADAIHYGYSNAYSLAMLWMSKVKVPGVDLPEDVPYQVHEAELMKVEDYDRILKEPWPEFYMDFLAKRVFDDVPAKYHPWNQERLDVAGAWAAIGVPVLSGGAFGTPFELFCGARSLSRFITDLFTIPDKVEAAMEAIVPHLAPPSLKAAKEQGCPFCWLGGWRAASNMLSPRLWRRFVWPYFQRLVNEVVEAGLVCLLHLDADWTRDLEFFRELPAKRCVLATDGQTDLFKAKEVLGDRICLMGDVPATMLTLGRPDEVLAYSTRLIRELGPQGFILQSGCDIPFDAKLENVQAMVKAATGG